MSELELKFHIPFEARDSLRSALLQHGATALHLQARYFDTPDSRLARHRVALRLRQEGTQWVQTVKAAGASPAHHLEHEVALDPGEQSEPLEPQLDLSRHDGSDAGAALRAALGDADEATLLARHGTDIQRLACLLVLDSGTQLEVAFDEGRVFAGEREQALCELEIEHKAGPVEGLFLLADSWVRHGRLSLSSIAKSARGERLRRGEAASAVKAKAPKLPVHADGEALFCAMLRATLQQVLDNASELAEATSTGQAPTEAPAAIVHQLRVGLRRLRSLLHALPELAGPLPDGLLAPITDVFRALGRQRDSKAIAAAVQPMLQQAGAPCVEWPEAAAEVDVPATVRRSDFQCALLQLLARLHQDSALAQPCKHGAAKALIAKRLDHLHHQLAKAARSFPQWPAEQQHLARKRLKRLRYLAELAGGLWPDAAFEGYLAALKRAQDALGHHNDVTLAAQAYRQQAQRDPQAWFAAGYLQASLQQTAKAAAKRLGQAQRMPRFWRG